jgi:curved DNA-binding protein CbpA
VISAAPSPFTPRFSIRNKNNHNTLLLQSSNVIRKYYCRPPHDTSLYDVLQIQPNSTLIDIQKNWRRLSREYHPDKVAIRKRKRQKSVKKHPSLPPPPPPISDVMIPPPPPPPINDDAEDELLAKQKLEELTHAYEVLSNDDSRLLYHKYGLVGGAEAIQILTGTDVGEVRNNADCESFARLSELMGYTTTAGVSTNHQSDRNQRLVKLITERLRPLVEGTISQDLFQADIIRECNLLKKVGLGAQILRCIGRAYRIEGYRVLRQMHHDKMSGRNGSQYRHGRRRKSTQHEVADILTDTLREAKYLSQAALSQGRLIRTEQRIKRLEEEAQKTRQRREQRQRFKKTKTRDESIHGENDSNIGSLSGDEEDNEDIESEYDNIGVFSDDEEEEEEEEYESDDDLEFELHHEQNKKIHSALQQAQQIEALWKLHKMELSSTIRRACRLILNPTSSAFCHPPLPNSTHDPYDGWVGTTGRVVPIDVGRLRAAAALVLVGDTLRKK